MARVLRMPEVADDPSAAMLTAWLVDESGTFGGAQSIATVETESSVVTVEVAEPGVLLKMLVAPGERVEAGRPLAVLASPGEIVEDVDQLMTRLGLAVAPRSPGADDASGSSVHSVARHTTWPPHEARGRRVARPSLSAVPPPAAPAPDATPASSSVRTPEPETELEVEVEPAPAQETEPRPVPAPRSDADRAPAPVTVPQVRLRAGVRAEALLHVVATVPDVSVTALVVKALVIAMRRVEAVPWSGTSTDVAVQRWTGRGSATTVVHVAGLMTPRALTAALDRLESRATEGRAEAALVTVVDLVATGATEASVDATPTRPVVLTLGAVAQQAVVEHGVLVPGQVLTLTLSCDESRVDAGAAARWLTLLTELLESPLHFLT